MTTATTRFTDISVTPEGGFEGLEEHGIPGGPIGFKAGFPLFLIREAMKCGVSFEFECDGFGTGAGSMGDWSAIRDSSDGALNKMLEKALNALFPGKGDA